MDEEQYFNVFPTLHFNIGNKNLYGKIKLVDRYTVGFEGGKFLYGGFDFGYSLINNGLMFSFNLMFKTHLDKKQAVFIEFKTSFDYLIHTDKHRKYKELDRLTDNTRNLSVEMYQSTPLSITLSFNFLQK